MAGSSSELHYEYAFFNRQRPFCSQADPAPIAQAQREIGKADFIRNCALVGGTPPAVHGRDGTDQAINYGCGAGLGTQAGYSRLTDRQGFPSGDAFLGEAGSDPSGLAFRAGSARFQSNRNYPGWGIICQGLPMKKLLLLPLAVVAMLSCNMRAQMQPTAAPHDPTGIEGTITMSPVQGGPTRQGSPDSRPLANITFEVKQGDRVITSFQTDERGHFQQTLEPGHYTISRKDWKSAIGSYGPFEVSVSRGKMTAVEWKCDTGIR